MPVDVDRTARERYLRLGATGAAVFALAASWRWTPLGEVVDVASILAAAHALREAPLGAIGGIAAFVVGGLVLLPVTALMAVAGFVYGGLLGYAVALLGTLASASASYALGRRLRRNAVRRLGGSSLNRLSRRLSAGGVTAIFAVRFVPVAPFSVVNLVAGATRLPFRDFLLGTLLAMAPGTALLVALGDQAAEFLAAPKPGTAAKIAAAAAALLAIGLGMRRLLVRRERVQGPGGGSRPGVSGAERAAARGRAV
jgi:uncharacterized membrane protein YdjX (TVP38/TMEM64 family)